MEKHAYLIMAHNNFYLLEKLLYLLDDSRNDVYLHIDQKVKMPLTNWPALLKKAKLSLVKPQCVYWGDFSQISTELSLYHAASQEYHAYYHLISGVDLPLKTQDEIHAFFAAHKGKEFFHLSTAEPYLYRANRYHYGVRWAKSGLPGKIMYKALDYYGKATQRIFHIDRVKRANMPFYFGASWASMTHDFILYLLSQEAWIKQQFAHTICCDELYKQTILMNSPFAHNRYQPNLDGSYEGCMRLIDWSRSPDGNSPYTFRLSDLDELLASDRLFARKFDCGTDQQVVDALFQTIAEKQGIAAK